MSWMTRGQNKAAEQAYYDRYGPEFTEAFPEALYERWFRLSGLWETSSADLLEAACGAGGFGYRLARRGHRVTGVDLSPVMVQRANAGAPPGFRAMAGDLEDAALFPPETFNVIFFGQALHHFPNIRRVVANCRRWLQPGGRLVLIEPNGSNPANAFGKQVGRFLAWHPAFRKAIGTVNEVNLPIGRVVRTLRQAGFELEWERYDAQFPSETEDGSAAALPWVLRTLGAVREGLYRLCWWCLPPRMGGIQFILGARKPLEEMVP